MQLLTPSPAPKAACTPHAQWPHSLLPQCPPTRRDVLLLNALQAQAQVLARPRAVHLRLVAVHGHHLDRHPGRGGGRHRARGVRKSGSVMTAHYAAARGRQCSGQTTPQAGWLHRQHSGRPGPTPNGPRSHLLGMTIRVSPFFTTPASLLPITTVPMSLRAGNEAAGAACGLAAEVGQAGANSMLPSMSALSHLLSPTTPPHSTRL